MAEWTAGQPAQELFRLIRGNRLEWRAEVTPVDKIVAFGRDMRAAFANDAASHAAMRLLKAECFSCHNGEKHKGGLVLSSQGSVTGVVHATQPS